MAANWREWLKPRPRTKRGAGLAAMGAAFVALGFVLLGYLYQNNIRIPPNTLPWQPVDLNAPPGWIAHWQLNRLAGDGPRCRAALAATRLDFTRLKDRRMGDGCGFDNVVRADRSPVAFSPRTSATCSLTAALYWYQQSLQAAAQATMHARLVRIDQLGTFACRNVNSQAEGSLSQHATANAIDIAAFHFADGRVASVVRDYGEDTAKGRFLDAAHDAACRLFDAVLGPHYNRLHANHFHLDMGPYRICR
jgi:hypothetical protein